MHEFIEYSLYFQPLKSSKTIHNISACFGLNHYFHIINKLMQNNKNKLYKFTPRNQQGQKMSDIYKLINQQEKTMADLLQRYQVKKQGEEKDGGYEIESRTIQGDKNLYRSLDYKKKRKNGRKEKNIQLPSLGGSKREKQKGTNKQKNTEYQKNPYFYEAKMLMDKQRIKSQVQKAYFTDNSKKLNRSRTRLSKQQPQTSQKEVREQKPNQNNIIKQKQSRMKSSRQAVQNQSKQSSIPSPLSYFKDLGHDESSSEQGQVPLTFYQKQYRGMIRQQCLQQTNFLYFSKNECMKDWTQSLLLLFQKHDKQLHSLRKKCRYLEKFDDNYFSIGIYREA